MKSKYKGKLCLKHLSESMMSSPPSSVTQQPESSVSTVVSNNENHHPMFTLYRDLSGQEVYQELRQLEKNSRHSLCHGQDYHFAI